MPYVGSEAYIDHHQRTERASLAMWRHGSVAIAAVKDTYQSVKVEDHDDCMKRRSTSSSANVAELNHKTTKGTI